MPPLSFRLRFVCALLLVFGTALAGIPGHAQEAEPNSSCLTAQDLGSISLPFTLSGSLDTPPTVPDVDFYRFTGTPGERIEIWQRGSISGAGTLADPFLGLFSSDCRLRNSNDDYKFNALDARIEVSVPADGVFIVAASSSYDWQFVGAGQSAGSYTLEVRTIPRAVAVGGRLVDAKTGAPLAGAWVGLVSCPSYCWTVGSMYSAADGTFRFADGDANLWDILRAGEYKLQIYPPEGYLSREVPAFQVAEGEDLDLGDVLVDPIPVVGSIRGHLVDAVTGAPLPGDAEPFASVQLDYCYSAWFCHKVASQEVDAQGGFSFESGVHGPLRPGTYRISASADQYVTARLDRFEVADGEHRDLGDVRVKSFPVRLTLAQGCGPIPAEGGDCSFSVRVTNGTASKLDADVWTLVRASYPAYGEPTRFQPGNTKSVNLSVGTSTELSYSFTVPAGLRNGSLICAKTYTAEKKNALEAIGAHDIFCLRKGDVGSQMLPEDQKRKALRMEEER